MCMSLIVCPATSVSLSQLSIPQFQLLRRQPPPAFPSPPRAKFRTPPPAATTAASFLLPHEFVHAVLAEELRRRRQPSISSPLISHSQLTLRNSLIPQFEEATPPSSSGRWIHAATESPAPLAGDFPAFGVPPLSLRRACRWRTRCCRHPPCASPFSQPPLRKFAAASLAMEVFVIRLRNSGVELGSLRRLLPFVHLKREKKWTERY